MELFRKGLTIKEVDDKGKVLAAFSTLNVIDKDGDVTLKGFFGEQEVIMLPAHDWNHVPLGKGIIREVGDQAIAEIQMNLDIQAAKEWHSHLKFDLSKGKPIQEWSYGFRVREGGSSDGEFEGQKVRFLKPLPDGSPGAKVHEVSPVVVGAGEGTTTLAAKGKDGVKFSDQAVKALASVVELVRRAEGIKALREKDGRSLSKDALAKLAEIHEQVKALAAELAVLSVNQPEKDENLSSDIAKEVLRAMDAGLSL